MEDWPTFFMTFRRRIVPMLAVLSAAVGIGGYALTARDIVDLGWPSWAWLAIGLSVFVVVIVADRAQFEHDMEKRLKKAESATPSVLSGATSLPSGVEFYCSRKERDYTKLLQGVEHAWVLWNTGGGLRRAHELPKILPHVDHVLLVCPNPTRNPSFDALSLAAETAEHKDETAKQRSRDDVRNAIIEVVKDIEDYNAQHDHQIEVRWRTGLAGSLITGCEEWVFVEQFFPALGATDRPSYKVNRCSQSHLYDSLRGAYDYMWAHAPVADLANLDAPMTLF